MDDLIAARLTMAISLGFHIIFASVGMVMPFLMVAAHRCWMKTGDPDTYRLTRAWGRGVAIFFATGAVSGTALSFELGILWPGFMVHAGPIIGMPFSLEGAAFFVEAIALGIYLYGWGKLSPRLHWWAGVIVGVAGVASGVLVVAANAWMNSPAGFEWINGEALDIDPWAAMFNDAWGTQAVHMVLAAFTAVGFAVAGIHALLRLRGRPDPMHGPAIRIALAFAAVAALLQPFQGHYTAQGIAKRQPAKLAAMEAHFKTSTRVPLLIGGIPDEDNGEVRGGIEIPGGLSFLAFNDFNAEVKGLDHFPRDQWPPVLITHFAFQTMVGIGTILAGLGLLGLFALWRRRQWLDHGRLLWALALATPLGFVAIEAGWIVTEVGRQPWIIYEILRTADALTPVPGQVFNFVLFVGLYGVIGLSTLWMWSRQVRYAHAIAPPSEALVKWARGTRP